MSKIQIVINAVLAAAIIALFALFYTQKPVPAVVENAPAPVVEGNLPIAYLNVDSLLRNYTFAIEANDKLMSKQEDARVKLNSKARTFQQEYADFQRKVENNAFLSRDRAESEANKLQRKQQEIEQLEAKLTQEIMIENQNLNMQLADTLNNFLKEFNADGRYQLILANNSKDNILMAADGYDITAEVVSALNARYKK